MKHPLIYVQDPNALKNWIAACGNTAKVLYDLNDLTKRFDPNNHILLIQIGERSSIDQVMRLAKIFDIVATSNNPQDSEGLHLFQNGIKGYINTYSTAERIEQAIHTVQAGSVWLGQSIMQLMIQSLPAQKTNNDGWKALLTEREQESANLVLQSKTNKEIARELGITERTVKAHLHNIFEKLEVNDRLGLALKIKNWQ
jgi:DNA-binding NarL/FixJ family response regulator